MAPLVVPMLAVVGQGVPPVEIEVEAVHIQLDGGNYSIKATSTWALEVGARWWWHRAIALAVGGGYAPSHEERLRPGLAFAGAGLRFWPMRGSAIALTVGWDASLVRFAADTFDLLPPCGPEIGCIEAGPRYRTGWRAGARGTVALELSPLRRAALIGRAGIQWLPRIGSGGPIDETAVLLSFGVGLLWRL